MDFLMRRQDEESANPFAQAGLANEYYQPTYKEVVGAYTEEAYKGVGTGYADYTALQVKTQESHGEAISAEDYKASPYYRASIPYYRNMTAESAKTLAEYDDERQKNSFIISKASGLQNVAGFATGFGAGVLEPKNVVTGLVASAVLSPILGELVPIGSSIRRVLQLKKVAGNYGAKALIGGAEGAAGALLAEPTNQYSAKILKQDYGMSDSMLNIALSAAFGAGFNTAPGFIKEKWQHHGGNTPDIVAHEIDMATNQLAQGQHVDVGAVESQHLLEKQINPLAKLTGTEVGESITPENRVSAARAYYLNNLQDTTVERPGFGTVQFTGKGWQKLKAGLRGDEEKLQLIPAIKDIIAKGDYEGRTVVDKARSDQFVAFHFFKGDVEVGGKIINAGVTVGEDAKGNLFYNINKDPDILFQKKKKAPGDSRDIALSREPSASNAKDTLAHKGDEVNLEAKPLSNINNDEAARVVSKYVENSVSSNNETAIDAKAAKALVDYESTIKDVAPEQEFTGYMDEVRRMHEEGTISDKEFSEMQEALDSFNEADLKQIHSDLYACLTRG